MMPMTATKNRSRSRQGRTVSGNPSSLDQPHLSSIYPMLGGCWVGGVSRAIPTTPNPHHERDWRIVAAFDPSTTLTTTAQRLGRARNECRWATQAAALVWLRAQLRMVEDTFAALQGQDIDVFYDCMKWDETKQHCGLEFGDASAGRHASRSGWNFMVSRRRFGFKVRGEPLQEVSITMPPVVLVGSVTADSFVDAIFHHPYATKSIVCCARWARWRACGSASARVTTTSRTPA